MWQIFSTNVYGYLKTNANNLKPSSELIKIKLIFESSLYFDQSIIQAKTYQATQNIEYLVKLQNVCLGAFHPLHMQKRPAVTASESSPPRKRL